MARVNLKQGRMPRRGSTSARGAPVPEVLQPFRGFAAAMTELARDQQAQRLSRRL
ncbi:MAG TPA: hypothetical protein VLI06_13180 [Solimonas sp.]|nr:hypothetical protein [Solimonas sp.]